jgi:hypothetical protein
MIPDLLVRKIPVPEASQEAFRRDMTAVASRAGIMVLCLAVGAQVVQDLGGTRNHVGWLHAAPAAGLLASLAYVHLGRGRDALRMLFWPEVISRLSLLGIGFLLGFFPTPNHPTIFTGLVFACACLGSMPYPFLSAVYGQIYPTEIRGQIIAFGRIIHALISIGVAFSLGVLLRHTPQSYRLLYPLGGVLGIAATTYFCKLKFSLPPQNLSRPPSSAWQIIREDHSFRRFQLFQFVFGFANLCAAPAVAIYVKENLQLSIDQRVLVVGHGIAHQVLLLVSVRFHGRLFDRIGVIRHRVLTSSLVGCGFFLWAWADNLSWALAASSMLGLGLAGGHIIWMIGSLSFANSPDHATYTGIHTFLTGLRGCLGPIAGVWLLGPSALDGDYRTFFLVMTALIFFSVLGHHFLVPPPEENRPTD